MPRFERLSLSEKVRSRYTILYTLTCRYEKDTEQHLYLHVEQCTHLESRPSLALFVRKGELVEIFEFQRQKRTN